MHIRLRMDSSNSSACTFRAVENTHPPEQGCQLTEIRLRYRKPPNICNVSGCRRADVYFLTACLSKISWKWYISMKHQTKSCANKPFRIFRTFVRITCHRNVSFHINFILKQGNLFKILQPSLYE